MKHEPHFNEQYERNEQVKGSSNRMFGLVFFVVFALVTLWPVLFGNPLGWRTSPIALRFLVVSFAAPRILTPHHKAWHWLGLQMHPVMNPLISSTTRNAFELD